jgi:hypothetical protein
MKQFSVRVLLVQDIKSKPSAENGSERSNRRKEHWVKYAAHERDVLPEYGNGRNNVSEWVVEGSQDRSGSKGSNGPVLSYRVGGRKKTKHGHECFGKSCKTSFLKMLSADHWM